MNLRETIDRYANAISSVDHWDDVGDEAKVAEIAKEVVALRDRIDARIVKAEAAERAVQAIVVWMHDSTTANWEPVMNALQEHADQGRVVRKLEEASESD